MEHRAGISPQEQRPPFRYDILGLFQIGPYPVMGQVARKLAELGANVVCGRYVHLGGEVFRKHKIILRMVAFDKPIIAAVNGYVRLRGSK